MSEVEELFQQIEEARKLARYPSQVENYHKLLVAAYESRWLAVVKPGTFDIEGNVITAGPFGGTSLFIGPGTAR